jgi:hypothetical protein
MIVSGFGSRRYLDCAAAKAGKEKAQILKKLDSKP